jgi:polyphosphate kinase 2 (PPK2 family)
MSQPQLPPANDTSNDKADSNATSGKPKRRRKAAAKAVASQPPTSAPIVEAEAAPRPSGDHAPFLTYEDLIKVQSPRDLFSLLQSKDINPKKIVELLNYENELQNLQIELVKLQRWVQEKKRRVAILFEGRDAAGKGGAIRRFTEHLNPRALRVVALPKPTEEEVGQWYFQRYTRQLPNRGEIVFFDRSWYNRAVVEPVNGFCTPEQYEQFIRQVTEYKHRLYEDSVTLIKFWFLISKEEQK